MREQGDISDVFRQQSEWCVRLGSPFTALLMDVLAEHLDAQTRTGERVLNWGPTAEALSDAVPLRLAGALNAAVRAGRAPELAAIYPPHPLPSASVLTDRVGRALLELDDELFNWLNFPPQTNETARSSLLYAGFMVIAQKTRLPLHLFELGASAGLNLIADKYGYRLGDVTAGDRSSPLQLDPEWNGPSPPAVDVEVVARTGCDQAPLDVQDPDHCARLLAYVWPDQQARVSRVEQAIALAQEERVKLDRADAAAWVHQKISVTPAPGVTRVLFHSIAWQYFDPADQARIERHMEEAGQNAHAKAPLAWLSFEQVTEEGPRLQLRLWPDGESQMLARADAHARQVTWLQK